MLTDKQENKILKGVIAILSLVILFSYINNKSKEKEIATPVNPTPAPSADVDIEVVNKELPKTELPKDNFAPADGTATEKKEESEHDRLYREEQERIAAQNAPLREKALAWMKANNFDIGKLQTDTDVNIINIAKKNGWQETN